MLDIQAYGRIASRVVLETSKDGKHQFINFLLVSHKNGDRKADTASRRDASSVFIRVVAFDAKAVLISKYFAKGDRIFLKGELISDNYISDKFKFKIKLEEFEFIETKEESEKHRAKHRYDTR